MGTTRMSGFQKYAKANRKRVIDSNPGLDDQAVKGKLTEEWRSLDMKTKTDLYGAKPLKNFVLYVKLRHAHAKSRLPASSSQEITKVLSKEWAELDELTKEQFKKGIVPPAYDDGEE